MTGTRVPPLRCRSEIRAASVPVSAACSGVTGGTFGGAGSLTLRVPDWAPTSGSCRRLSAAAQHLEADQLLRDLAFVLADDLPFVEDEDAVGEREDLVELERDQEDRPPLVALLDETPMEVLDRADVESARGLRRDQHLRVARDLSRRDHLLLVA